MNSQVFYEVWLGIMFSYVFLLITGKFKEIERRTNFIGYLI